VNIVRRDSAAALDVIHHKSLIIAREATNANVSRTPHAPIPPQQIAATDAKMKA
jgi:hypothetical protein